MTLKLNRRQRKEYERKLQAIVLNQRDSGTNASYTLEERQEAVRHLIIIGQDGVAAQTINRQLMVQDPADAEFNRWLMELMTEGFKAGLADVENEEGDEDDDE
jgi:hypothetical protein